MIKKIIASIIVLIIILFSINIVNATSGSSSLNASSTSVKPKGTFKVTLSVKCEEGINGIDTSYSYDEDKLELVSAEVANDNWLNMGKKGVIQVICNTTSKITSNNIYVLTFKVKDNATVGTTAKVSTSEIKVDSDVDASNFTDKAKSVNINIVSENTGTSDNNNNNNGRNQNTNTSSNKLETNVTDKSINNEFLPYTGTTNTVLLIVFIVLASICSLIFYIKIVKVRKDHK